MSEPLPVLVVGLGPAGAATAIGLAQAGRRVVGVDRVLRSGRRIGESLSPDAAKVLRELGVWDEFEAAGHTPCWGNRSHWQTSTASYHDFIEHPEGHGWHVDRVALDDMLRRRAADAGATLHPGIGVAGLTRTEAPGAPASADGWTVSLTRRGGDVPTGVPNRYSFVVDATGRSSRMARQLGVARLMEHLQLALVAFLGGQVPLADSVTLTETVPGGWWYCAPVPGGEVATAFFCHPDNARRRWTDPSHWWDLVNRSTHTVARLQPGFELLEPPRLVSAHSGILERLYGPGWLAVGDAAMTYDPLAAHGLTTAMVSGRDAARAIDASLDGDPDALVGYGDRLYRAFAAYAETRKSFYQPG